MEKLFSEDMLLYWGWELFIQLWYKAYQYLNALYVCEREWDNTDSACVLMCCKSQC